MTPATALADLTEREWAAQVVELATALGWIRYHTFRSDKSAPGWPDEALLRERLILVELKSEKGKLSDAQTDWIRKLIAAHVEVYIARPRHLADLAFVLQSRGRPGRSELAVHTRVEVGLPP